jgi:hypothetical protein
MRLPPHRRPRCLLRWLGRAPAPWQPRPSGASSPPASRAPCSRSARVSWSRRSQWRCSIHPSIGRLLLLAAPAGWVQAPGRRSTSLPLRGSRSASSSALEMHPLVAIAAVQAGPAGTPRQGACQVAGVQARRRGAWASLWQACPWAAWTTGAAAALDGSMSSRRQAAVPAAGRRPGLMVAAGSSRDLANPQQLLPRQHELGGGPMRSPAAAPQPGARPKSRCLYSSSGRRLEEGPCRVRREDSSRWCSSSLGVAAARRPGRPFSNHSSSRRPVGAAHPMPM